MPLPQAATRSIWSRSRTMITAQFWRFLALPVHLAASSTASRSSCRKRTVLKLPDSPEAQDGSVCLIHESAQYLRARSRHRPREGL